MDINSNIKIKVNTDRTILSSKFDVLKTQSFIKDTKSFLGVDFFISKIAEEIISEANEFVFDKKNAENTLFNAEDLRREHDFAFRVITDNERFQLIFTHYTPKDLDIRHNDRRFLLYSKLYPAFEMIVSQKISPMDKKDFVKLYHIWNNDGVNFPLLTFFQKSLIEKEDENVLVQGVAGSGKTNVCINKIVFAASRGYSENVLYTTFSRGLLVDTQTKINYFVSNLKSFVKQYEENKIQFLDDEYSYAIEQKLGIYLNGISGLQNNIKKLKEIADFLENKVEYKLLEDFYLQFLGEDVNFANENFFTKKYLFDIKNHQIKGKLSKIEYLSAEVIFKEIYGMIFGCCDMANAQNIMSQDDYVEKRKDSFSKNEAEIIYALSQDYSAYLQKNNLFDNNIIARELLLIVDDLPKYSLAVIDEVQDITEIALYLFKQLTIKIFAVGDALQMINPSFFSFSYLKRLMFEKDIVTVKELAHNYRNSKKIVEIIDGLSKINVRYFGTHSFVIQGKCVDTSVHTEAIFVRDKDFIPSVVKENFDDITIVVANQSEKDKLREILKKQEILTVSEIKGLERDTVVLYNAISANADKWSALERTNVNRKVADENSVYRYYFNLFYVGVTRARLNLFVVEEKDCPSFRDFFNTQFENLNLENSITRLATVAKKIQIDEEELVERIYEFINAEQYDNARFASLKILDYDLREKMDIEIEISEKYIKHGKYRDAGIAFWEKGCISEAKKMFNLSGDSSLIDLMEASIHNSSASLNIDIVDFYPQVLDSEAAKKLILKAINDDYKAIEKSQKELKLALKTKRTTRRA